MDLLVVIMASGSAPGLQSEFEPSRISGWNLFHFQQHEATGRGSTLPNGIVSTAVIKVFTQRLVGEKRDDLKKRLRRRL